MLEDLCQTLDIVDTAESGRNFDKLTLEEFLRTRGAGDSALAAFTVGTRAMLGTYFNT